MTEKLQKFLASSGLGSRRSCEKLIRDGRVRINGEVAAIGDRVNRELDQVHVDGNLIKSSSQHRYIKLHKPVGYLSSTRSQGGHPTIYDLLDLEERVHPVGRLDLDSEGLMLLTTDGELTLRLTHPRYQHEKEYHVLFDKTLSNRQIDLWQRGVKLPDGTVTLPAEIELLQKAPASSWYRVVLREGRKRQIRAMASVLGLTVLRLIRTRIDVIRLGTIEPGKWQDCTSSEVSSLMKLIG